MNSKSMPIGGQRKKADMILLKRAQKARGGDCNSDRWDFYFGLPHSMHLDENSGRSPRSVVTCTIGIVADLQMSSDVIDFFDLAQRERAGVAQNRRSLLFLLGLFGIRHFHHPRHMKTSTSVDKKRMKSRSDYYDRTSHYLTLNPFTTPKAQARHNSIRKCRKEGKNHSRARGRHCTLARGKVYS